MFKKLRRIGKELVVDLYNFCFNRPQGVVPMLHRVGEMESDRLSCIEDLKVTIARLQCYIDAHRATHDFVSLDHVAKVVRGELIPKRPFVAVTLDDGYRDNLTNGLPFFEKNQIPFSVFLTTEFVNRRPTFNYPFILERIVRANNNIEYRGGVIRTETLQEKHAAFSALKEEVLSLPYDSFETEFLDMFAEYVRPEYNEDLMMTWDEVRQLAASPLCTIGAHTMTHCRLSNVPLDKLPYELAESKRLIEHEIGKEVKYISYPYGWKLDVNENVLAATKAAGYEMGLISWGGPIRRKDHNIFVVKRQMLMENE